MASSLEGNKLIAGILTAGIIAVGSGVFSRIVYSPHMLEENVYHVEVAAADGGAPKEEEVQPIAVRLASADVAKGQTQAKKCQACHDFSPNGANKIGPALWDVVGRPIGKHAGFSYSEAVANHGGNWTYEELDAYLHSPKTDIPGNKMAFAGIAKPQDRADVIAFLHSLNPAAPPLPAP